MLIAFKVLIIVFATFFALCIACAIWHARRRVGGIGVSRAKHPRHVDPYSIEFGDVTISTAPGYCREQLERFTESTRRRIERDHLNRSLDLSPSATALRRNAGSGHSDNPSGMSAARNSFAWRDSR